MISRTQAMAVCLFILIVSVGASGCSSSPAESADQKPAGQTIEKKGDTAMAGKLTNKGGKFFIERSGKTPQVVESYSVDLASYTDKNVTITGQFSGDTLFAGKIEAQ